MDKIADGNINVCDKRVFGCKNNDRDIMLTFMEEREKGDRIEFNDWFLTQLQAKVLFQALGDSIWVNEECNDEVNWIIKSGDKVLRPEVVTDAHAGGVHGMSVNTEYEVEYVLPNGLLVLKNYLMLVHAEQVVFV